MSDGCDITKTQTSLCVNEDCASSAGTAGNHSGPVLCESKIETLDDMGTVCCETLDFDDFNVDSKSPSMTNVLDANGYTFNVNQTYCSGKNQISNDTCFMESVTCIEPGYIEPLEVLTGNNSDDNLNDNDREDSKYKFRTSNRSFSHDDDSSVNNDKASTLHELGNKGNEDADSGTKSPHFYNKNYDESAVDASAGLRDLLQKLFITVKRFIPIKSANIQELLERPPYSDDARQGKSSEEEQSTDGNFEGVLLNLSDLFHFENILQTLFQEFQEEWMAYQHAQEKRFDDVFLRGVQAARYQAEAEAMEKREEALRIPAPNIPQIVTKSAEMIKELRRERCILAKYIIEKEHEWSILRENLAREIANLRKDNTRLLSNKLSSVNSTSSGKGSKIAPFSQRTLESMVHAKYSLEKALMLDVGKQSKINELSLLILKQQEHIRELQNLLFDASSASMVEEVQLKYSDRKIESEARDYNVTQKPKMSDTELLDYIIKDMRARVFSRTASDNAMQVLYCDEDYYVPNVKTSADLATMKVYCLGGTWRTNLDCPKLNSLKHDNSTKVEEQRPSSDSESIKNSGDSGDKLEKTTVVVTSPNGNTQR